MMQVDTVSGAKFSTSEALRFGAQMLSDNFGFLVFASFLFELVARVPSLAGAYVRAEIVLPLDAADLILSSIVAVGLVRVALNFARHGSAGPGDFFSSYSLAFRFAWASFLYGLRALVPWSVGVAILLLTVGFAADTPHLWTSRPIVFVDVAVAAIVCRFLWGALGHGGRAVVLRSILGTGVFFAYLTVRRFLLPVPHSGSFWWDTPADALGALMVSAAATIVCAVVAAVIFFAVRGCVRLVDLQFFGHAMIDGRLSVSAAFARSSSIAQQARRDLFLFDLLFLGASAIAGALPVGFAAIAGGQHPSDTAASVVKEFVLLAGWLIVWPFLIAHAFIYRKLADA